MKSREVRERFLKFFEENGHRRVPSSSLIPAEDPTLLFTNAGMNQFKDVFTGREKRSYSRATTTQKCVRAGGKHNDLDNVGYTARHHTFFEMLGNFSFGDYFKKEAIALAWDLTTGPVQSGGYGLPVERLWFTVYTDDDEAARLWEAVGAPRERILRFGEKDNFWAMGETGPCGPCSEIHYYRGGDLSGNLPGLVNGPGDDTMEIWNLVFMQYERDASGAMAPLPKPSVDTGAGLERIASILQGVNNNFDTDLFSPILRSIEEISGRRYRGGMAVEDAPFRVIADHARAAAMLMADGVVPSNEGRGYVLRRIVRRALRYGRHLGVEEPMLHRLVPSVLSTFSGVFFAPAAVGATSERVAADLRAEEELFVRTLNSGIDRIGEEIEGLRRSGRAELSGDSAFRLYDTYGIPLDLIRDIARDEGVTVDVAGFDAAMEAQRSRSQSAAKFQARDVKAYETLSLPPLHSEFRGYPEDDFVRLSGARVVALLADGHPVDDLAAGSTGDAVADRTVFYPEGGGQIGDSGTWIWAGGRAAVEEARRPVPGLIVHRLKVIEGTLRVGSSVDMEVPEWVRRRTQANHTGTHLLHAALRAVLGESARQMGSLVAPDRLRFDYSARAPLTAGQIAEIERLVNEEILRDKPVSKEVVAREEADRRGAIAFFGEKYGDRVRVVDVPGFSTELCGGCHVGRTGEIGAFKIVSDRGLAAGVRRIEAVTSLGVVELLRSDEDLLAQLVHESRAEKERLPETLRASEERVRHLEKEVAALRLKLATGGGEGGGADGVVDVAGVKVLAREAPGLSVNELRALSDTLRGKLKSGIVAVGSAGEGRASVVISVTADLASRIPAARIAERVGPALGGRGGGRAELAQVGGRDESLLGKGLAAAVAAVREILGS